MLDGGIIKIKQDYLKIIKINPINYNLKSQIEQESILNSYKIFLKTCNFDMQILIQNKKENLSQYSNKIENIIKKEKEEIIKKISKQYINFIQKINIERNSLNKTFYIIVKSSIKNNEENNFSERRIKEDLKEKYLKIKECLARCGNYAEEIKDKDELKQILNSFFYVRNYINRLKGEKEE